MPGLRLDDFTLAAVRKDLESGVALGPADAIEFRMDRATDPLDQFDGYAGSLPVIATNRAEWEGGGASENGRLETLRSAATDPAVAAVDVELDCVDDPAAEAVRRAARDHEAIVIVSWHDFDETPDRSALASRLRRATTWGDVGKLATTAQSVEDVLDVLDVTHEFSSAERTVATMCMGDVGRHSRVIAPLYGSRIGYAPVDPADATAPGQYTLEEMADVIDAVRT